MTVRRYRKRPIEVEAVLWDGTLTGATEIIDWILTGGERAARWHEEGASHIAIDTLEGTMRAEPGDWVIRGIQGEFYPCKPGIFVATYEPVVHDAARST